MSLLPRFSGVPAPGQNTRPHINSLSRQQEADLNRVSPDLRDRPLYGVAEAAHYLHLAPATLRSWVLGRAYPVKTGERFFPPLIAVPDPQRDPRLSFFNLVEAHNLRALRTRQSVPIRAVREALDVAQRKYGIDRLLISRELYAGAGELFLERFGELVSLNRSGQLALRKVLEAHLERIAWDPDDVPGRLYPFVGPNGTEARLIAIDPRIGFGRPVVVRKGISTTAIVDRLDAGEDIDDLAADYGLEPAEVEEALLYERAA